MTVNDTKPGETGVDAGEGVTAGVAEESAQAAPGGAGAESARSVSGAAVAGDARPAADETSAPEGDENPAPASHTPSSTAEDAVPLKKSTDAAAAAVAVPSVPGASSPAKESGEPADPPQARAAVWGRVFADRAHALVAGAAVLLAVAAVVLGVLWRGSAADLDALRTSQSDRETAARVASDYTLRSLTYDYKNLPAFFAGVQSGTSDALRARYDEVHDTLTKIMTEAQVVATGQVAGTSVRAMDNDQFEVLVYATQRTSNIQQAEPVTKPNLLVVTVAESGGEWLVVNYGPKDAGDKAEAGKEGAAK